MKISIWVIHIALVVLRFASVASADVIDPYDSMSAPPGTVALYSYFGQTHYPDIAGNSGDKYHIGYDQSYMLIRPVYFMGKIGDKLSYGVNAILSVANIGMDGADNEFGIGDIGISPFIYLYENPDSKIYLSFWEFIFMPTGRYDENSIFNIGRNAWWFQHQLAFGWYPNQFGMDLNVNYFQFTESDKLKYDEPDAFELETVVHYGITDKLRAGVHAAYWVGTENIVIDGFDVPDTKPLNVKLGLNLSYSFSEKITGGIRWMHDVDSINYPSGDWVYVRLAYIF